jgi:periplasmic protein TonB
MSAGFNTLMSFAGAGIQTALPLRQRVVIMSLAVIAHGVLLAQPWLPEMNLAGSEPRVLSVNIIGAPSHPKLSPEQAVKPLLTKPEHGVTETVPVVSQPSVQVSQENLEDVSEETPDLTDTGFAAANSGTPALPDREPDYRAAYLDNPQPEYPLVARHMGWQGRVMLDVEVKTDGLPGEIFVQQSSGRPILDEAAIRSVQGWHFVPASRGGFTVTQHVLVPIAFFIN